MNYGNKVVTGVPHSIHPSPYIGIDIYDWRLVVKKESICHSKELEELFAKLNAPALPEMIFGNNLLEIKNLKNKFTLHFTAEDALKIWKNNPVNNANLKVAYSDQWSKQVRTDLTENPKQADYDWTFSSCYKGSINLGDVKGEWQDTPETIDLEKLKRPDPILFYQDLILYEDELADNGQSMLSVRVRVMPSSFYILLRFWLRVDNVVLRAYDSRFYHEFNTNYILREFQHRESPYNEIKTQDKPGIVLHDPNSVVPHLTLKETKTEKFQL